LNLSIEHYIFQNAPAGSRILFFYRNRPCIVIGRNQNPWLEVNLRLLSTGLVDQEHGGPTMLQDVDLVRRRSGGGTVFHDSGNVNWSVICDLNEFTRDKHAEMVVRALRATGIERARVNERHDIVVDTGAEGMLVDSKDTHLTPYTTIAPSDSSKPAAVKVSGSAYKLARNRALHHGTALLNSTNLQVIPNFLRSPAKQHITAKGVASVSSPISNIGIENAVFEQGVEAEFRSTYRLSDDVTTDHVGAECLEIPEIKAGYEELKVGSSHMFSPAPALTIQSEAWTYLQTPQFLFEVSSPHYVRTSGDPDA
jgi:lipoate-protein ligase A